ncbi:MAG: hypothetical protein WCT14_08445 [Treponemataceae bacterium]
MDTHKFRDSLIDRAATAFAQDKLDEAAFEAFVARVQTAPDEAELRAAEASLAPFFPAAAPETVLSDVREIELNMSNLKKRGDWVDARAYRLDGKMSNFELDYLAYSDAENFSMTLDVDLSMSNLKLIIPSDWQVDCRLTRNSASNVKDRGPFPTRSANRIVIVGALSMSNIKVRRRGERRGLFALLFGR